MNQYSNLDQSLFKTVRLSSILDKDFLIEKIENDYFVAINSIVVPYTMFIAYLVRFTYGKPAGMEKERWDSMKEVVLKLNPIGSFSNKYMVKKVPFVRDSESIPLDLDDAWQLLPYAILTVLKKRYGLSIDHRWEMERIFDTSKRSEALSTILKNIHAEKEIIGDLK